MLYLSLRGVGKAEAANGAKQSALDANLEDHFLENVLHNVKAERSLETFKKNGGSVKARSGFHAIDRTTTTAPCALCTKNRFLTL